MKPSVYTQIYQGGLLILKLGKEDLIKSDFWLLPLKKNRKKIWVVPWEVRTYPKPKKVSTKRAWHYLNVSMKDEDALKSHPKGLPWWSDAGCTSLIPNQGDRIPHASWSRSQGLEQKQYCNKFNKDFKNKKNLKVIPNLKQLNENYAHYKEYLFPPKESHPVFSAEIILFLPFGTR